MKFYDVLRKYHLKKGLSKGEARKIERLLRQAAALDKRADGKSFRSPVTISGCADLRRKAEMKRAEAASIGGTGVRKMKGEEVLAAFLAELEAAEGGSD